MDSLDFVNDENRPKDEFDFLLEAEKNSDAVSVEAEKKETVNLPYKKETKKPKEKKKVSKAAGDSSSETIVFRARMDSRLYRRLRILCAIMGTSFSAVLEESVEAFIKKNEGFLKMDF